MFRRPKKNIQRRVYSAADEDDTENEHSKNDGNRSDDIKMEVERDSESQSPPPAHHKEPKKDKKPKTSSKSQSSSKPSLLSFGDDEDEGEVFQVKKTSQSKKVMKMLDKERRKKKKHESHGSTVSSKNGHDCEPSNDDDLKPSSIADNDPVNKKRPKDANPDPSTHTEIRTDDFVLVVKKTEPMQILNGRAALCAGRDDMSSEDEGAAEQSDEQHRFNKPDKFKTMLESGAIPDAAMIHAARKKRQKARELGDFVSLEEKKPVDNRKGRLVREDVDDDLSDGEERVNMSAITGVKEREERMEKFYSIQENSDQDSDREMDEWENQQIRKGVTGAQLISAQQESAIYSKYLRPKSPVHAKPNRMSTANLLEQAYAHSTLERPRKLLASKKAEKKSAGPRMPTEVFSKMKERLAQVKELNASHTSEIDRITREVQLMKMDALQSEQDAPVAAAKFRFYQELKCYVQDLVECLDEKLPKIVELERKSIGIMSKQANMLIERRRQDTRDQAKEATQKSMPVERVMNNALRKEEDERIRRTAEREGRRTRRRRDRERVNMNSLHLDGMSSDDEIGDQEAIQYKNQLKQINAEATLVFEDVTDEFCQTRMILERFEAWRSRDRSTYTDTYFSLCLPKILGPMLRLSLITWNPLDENCADFERMEWYEVAMSYGYDESETEATLADDPDVRLVPTLTEKILLPKITEIIETCWDPMSSSQTLRMVNLLRRVLRDYPSMRPTSKYARSLLLAVTDKMKLALENDVFIPIFPKQMQEAKSSFFQRQFSSALKLLRSFLSWEGILSDMALKEIAILSLLNRYLFSGLRVCSPVDAVSKAHNIVNTLPRVWLQQETILESLNLFISFLRTLLAQLDRKNPTHKDSIDKMKTILCSLHSSITT